MDAALPKLESPFPLDPQQVAHYQENGYALIRNLASAEEIAPFRQAIKISTDRMAAEYRPMHERDTYGKAFIQNMNLWVNDPVVAAFTLSRRFAKVAAELMGVKGVRLYHDQALFKEPGGGPTPWHQDQQYWPLDGTKCVTLWMPLIDVDDSMGTMNFAAKSQTIGYLGPMNISDDSEAELAKVIASNKFEVKNAGQMKAGDATFHDGWVIHGAPGNNSAQTREVMTIIYFEDGAQISRPDSPQRESDLTTWFPGLNPGDLAASPINPIAYV